MWDMVTLKPWLGYGYSGFGTAGKSPGGWYVEQIDLATAAWPQWFYGYAVVTVGAVGLALLLLNYGKNLLARCANGFVSTGPLCGYGRLHFSRFMRCIVW